MIAGIIRWSVGNRFLVLMATVLLVAAGLTPKAALLAGTSNSALALGLAGDRGTIEKGKRADLVRVRKTDSAPVVRGVWRQGKRVS